MDSDSDISDQTMDIDNDSAPQDPAFYQAWQDGYAQGLQDRANEQYRDGFRDGEQRLLGDIMSGAHPLPRHVLQRLLGAQVRLEYLILEESI